MKLEFGIRLPGDPAQITAFSQEAEALNFDYLVCGEHVMFHGPTTNAFVSLAVAAGATKRIKLLSAITLLPLYPAVLAAKLTATLDVVSHGRFNLGVGAGGENPKEFAAIGVPVKQRGSRTNEALEVIHKLLGATEKVSFQGKYTQFEDARILPQPVQKPRPPIWVAGRKEAAMRRAARFADVWLPYMYSPEDLQKSLDQIRGFEPEYGREPGAVEGAIYAFTSVYADSEKAKKAAAAAVGKSYQQDFSTMVDRYLVAGTPEYCRQRIRQYVDAGCRKVIVALACPEEDKAAMLQMVAAEILPEFRA